MQKYKKILNIYRQAKELNETQRYEQVVLQTCELSLEYVIIKSYIQIEVSIT